MNKLFSAVMLFGIYSLLSAALFVALDAVDVAFTEAAVGAGIATILALGALALTTNRQRQVSWRRQWAALLVVSATGVALIYATLDMPPFGDPAAPIHGHVVPRYLQQSMSEIGVPNVVTSVLASYRGYDTLGEVTVIFTAAVAVIGRFRTIPREKRRQKADAGMAHHLILHVTAKLMLPLILLFALYVQFHGDFGPGGGFQAGVIFASAFILHGLVFGLDNSRKVAPPNVIRGLCATGVLIYAGVGIASMLLGANFLDYRVFGENPVAGQHLGILLIELGVGITVASAMINLFYSFASHKTEPSA